MNRILITILLLTSGASTAVLAQETEAKPPAGAKKSRVTGIPLIAENALTMSQYVPKTIDARTLSTSATRLFGRKFLVGAERHEARGPVNNILHIGNAVMVYDTKERVPAILSGLAELEAAGGQKERPPVEKTEVLEYSPRHVSANSLQQALQAYVGRSSRRTRGKAEISSVSDLNRIVVRGTGSDLTGIRKFIAKLDVPKPEVTVTCWIVQGTTVGQEEEGQPPLPGDLIKNLKKLVPFPHFNPLGMGLIRTSVAPEGSIEMTIDLENFGQADIDLNPEGFDPESGTLHIGRCKCSVMNKRMGSRQTFKTRASIKPGGYTVLGALGSKPIFVILQLSKAHN